MNPHGLLYSFIIFLANTIGAVSGMVGGVIIKPLLDVIGLHSVASISFYSAIAVFTKAVVSTSRQMKQGIQLSFSTVASHSLGDIVGGVLGNGVLNVLLTTFANDQLVLLFQIILTIVSLIFAFVYTCFRFASWKCTGRLAYLLCGLFLGTLASLLGIGGGPINVSLLMLVFAFPIKEATVYSIATILFSQMAKLCTIFLQGDMGQYDLGLLVYIVPAAMLAGFLGAYLRKKLSVGKVEIIFKAVIILVIAINGHQLL